MKKMLGIATKMCSPLFLGSGIGLDIGGMIGGSTDIVIIGQILMLVGWLTLKVVLNNDK